MKSETAAPKGDRHVHPHHSEPGRQAKTSARLGYATWNPNTKSLATIDQVLEILEQYDDYLPMTGRQIFYRLVATYGYPKDEWAYKRLLSLLNKARRGGQVQWEAIRDDGVTIRPSGGFDDTTGFWQAVHYAADRYELDATRGQRCRIELWVEAAGMVPQAQQAVDGLGVTVVSSGGFNSTTAKHDAAKRFAENARSGLETVLLHVGDHDPSGVAIYTNLKADLAAFLLHLVGTSEVLSAERVALTPEQAIVRGSPSSPPKPTDSRSKTWQGPTWQAEALAPDDLAGIIRAAALEWIDEDILEETQAQSVRDREVSLEQIWQVKP